MKLIAKKRLSYCGNIYVAGDAFEARDKDARLLKAIGKAENASVADAEPEPVAKRTYRRRDLRAENGHGD